ncbi:MAG: pyridoxamine 5'-phosphate oxidase [Pseudomonadota bacterium]
MADSERTGIFAGDDPFDLARAWLAEAEGTEPEDANAIAIATVDEDDLPNVRMVLLKEIEANGFVFYTNFEGKKGQELAANPKAAFVMHWKSLRRQVRVRGPVERVEDEQADAYYASRSLKSRLGAWASRQSRPLESRGALMAEVATVTASHGPNPTRPPFWGGFRIRPVEIEFWADGSFRLHDRFRWTRPAPDGDNWRIERLNP